MAKRIVKTETLTVSRQQEVLVADEELSIKNNNLALLKELVGRFWGWLTRKILKNDGESKNGDSNN